MLGWIGAYCKAFEYLSFKVRLRWLGAVLQHYSKCVVFQLSTNVIIMIIHHHIA